MVERKASLSFLGTNNPVQDVIVSWETGQVVLYIKLCEGIGALHTFDCAALTKSAYLIGDSTIAITFRSPGALPSAMLALNFAEAACAKDLLDWIREMNPPRVTPPRQFSGSAKMLAGVVALILIGWGLETCAGKGGGASSTPSPTYTGRHAAREAAQVYWNPVLNELALAGAAVSLAVRAEEIGNAVEAEQILAQAVHAVKKAKDAADSSGVPDGNAWMSIQGELFDAAGKYEEAIKGIRDGLGNGNTETIANALDEAQSARSELDSATQGARNWYVTNGGNSSDIEDLPTAERSAEKLLKFFATQSQ